MPDLGAVRNAPPVQVRVQLDDLVVDPCAFARHCRKVCVFARTPAHDVCKGAIERHAVRMAAQAAGQAPRHMEMRKIENAAPRRVIPMQFKALARFRHRENPLRIGHHDDFWCDFHGQTVSYKEGFFNKGSNIMSQTAYIMSIALPILIPVFCMMAFSAFWYAPRIFGNSWVELAHIPASAARHTRSMMLFTFFANIAQAATLYIVHTIGQIADAQGGFIIGVWLGCGLTAMSVLIPYLWEGRPIKLFLIVGGHNLCAVILMSALMGALRGQLGH